METLREAKEEDLRLAGLKMGDIIKIRRHIARTSSDDLSSSLSSDSLNGSLSSGSLSGSPSRSPELEPGCKHHEAPVKSRAETKSRDEESSKQTQEESASSVTKYSAKELLQKCLPRMKCTRAQLYFRNLLRDCAKEARIWEKAYTLPAIPDGKLHKFFELITTAAPQLASHKTEVKARLGQALQNKRKYVNDVKAGKRKGRSGKGDTKDDETVQKCLDGYLVRTIQSLPGKQRRLQLLLKINVQMVHPPKKLRLKNSWQKHPKMIRIQVWVAM